MDLISEDILQTSTNWIAKEINKEDLCRQYSIAYYKYISSSIFSSLLFISTDTYLCYQQIWFSAFTLNNYDILKSKYLFDFL